MKRRRTWWLAAALLGLVALASWWVTPPASTEGVGLHFRYFTNHAVRVGEENMTAAQRARAPQTNLLPSSHAVVEVRNDSTVPVQFLVVMLHVITNGVPCSPLRSISFSQAGNSTLSEPLNPGESSVVELALASTTGPWVASGQFLRMDAMRRMIRNLSPLLPDPIRKRLVPQSLEIEETSTSFRMPPGSTSERQAP